ncbi:MAG TPA: YkvA family protein [Rhodanobacteraceae bacterium]|nr:YkvA family protein [Rhodanobacteraceae bacterium]
MPQLTLYGVLVTLARSPPAEETDMALDIELNLSDDDLGHFTQAMREAEEKAKGRDGAEIIASARKLLEETRETRIPAFIRARLDSVETMIGMASDTGFGLPAEDCQRVLAVLAYLADPVDFIPDTVPALGFLDDAIMIELCRDELRFELEAYEDFCAWREQEASRHGVDPATLSVQRVDWAEARRQQAIERMHRRRRESYVSGEWRPTLFSVR